MTEGDQTVTAEASQLTGETDERLAIGVQWVFPDTRGRLVTWLTGKAQVVGRDASCDTVLVGDEISRHHAELRRAGTLCLVRDLDSKNGVFVNGQPVSSAAFSAGDVVRVGGCVGVAVRAGMSELLEVGELGPGMVGGVVLRRVVAQARAAAASALPVALVGETGTGKERFARAIHEWSGRSGPLLAVNCAGYSEALAFAQLFGHRKGAFTGAENGGLGHVRSSDRGTLFLDEIAELPPSVQAQLLRVVECGEVLPVGETKVLSVDVRFVSASQVPLARLVEEQRFRADLQARLEGVRLMLPALRERRTDIPHLAQTFLLQHGSTVSASMDARLAEALCLRPWTLNVRELELVMRRLLTLFPGEPVLKLSKVASALGDDQAPNRPSPAARRERPVDDAQRDALRTALERCNGNLTKAAIELGITRARAYRLLGSKGQT